MSNAPLVTAATGSQQARVPANNPRGVSALLYACQQGDVDKVRRILRAQPNALLERDRTGKTALHYCCTSDHIAAAQAADVLVMAAPDLVDGRDEDGFTPLHLAVIAGNIPLVTFLLANNADINAVDNEKHTVVHWGTVCGETVALRAVLAAGAPVSTPDVHGGYPLHYAAQMCGGEKDSALGLQVLHTLLSHQEISVLVEDGDGRQPLLWAASAGSAKAVLALTRAGAAVESHDKDGLTALHCSASRGHTDCIDTLLTLCGASPDVIDSNGCTALHYAVTLGHADATALLLAHAADPNRQDRKGRSPAHCGCAKGQFETVKMLGTHGANLWLRNARGDLPLHEAAASGRRDLVKWLLEARPSHVNARNNDGRCPLHLAALNDNADMCKILLDTGAQVNSVLRTSKNVFMTPLDCALQRGFRATAKYIQLHGGVPANRLTGVPQTQGVGSAVSLHIRDDVTLWGDTSSESEKEEVVGKLKSKKKTYKRKLAYKYEKKKIPISASEYESGKLTSGKLTSAKLESEGALKSKDNGKSQNSKINQKEGVGHHSDFPFLGNNIPPGEIFIYANEVNINEKFGGSRIQQNGEITVSESSKIPRPTDQMKNTAAQTVASTRTSASSLSDKQEKRPKSAKYGRLKNKSGKQSEKTDSGRRKPYNETPDPRRKQPNEENYPAYKGSNTDEDIVVVKDDTKDGKPVKEKDVLTKTEETKQAVNDNSLMPAKEECRPGHLHIKDAASAKTEIQRSTEKPRIIYPDQQSARSNTSYEDGEDHKQLIVEASVHSPPREITEGAISTKNDLEVGALPHERRSTPIGSEALSDDNKTKISAPTIPRTSSGEQIKDHAEGTATVKVSTEISKTPSKILETSTTEIVTPEVIAEATKVVAETATAVLKATTVGAETAAVVEQTATAIEQTSATKETEKQANVLNEQAKDGISNEFNLQTDIAETSTLDNTAAGATATSTTTTPTTLTVEVPTITTVNATEKLETELLATKNKTAGEPKTSEQIQSSSVAPSNREESKIVLETTTAPVITPTELKTASTEQKESKAELDKSSEQQNEITLSTEAKADIKPSESGIQKLMELAVSTTTVGTDQDPNKAQDAENQNKIAFDSKLAEESLDTKDDVKTIQKEDPKQHDVESETSSDTLDSIRKSKRKEDEKPAEVTKKEKHKKKSAHKKVKKLQESPEKPTVTSSKSHKITDDQQVIKTTVSTKSIKSPQDSSIDAKSSEESEEETSPSSSSPSSTVSVTKKEHKSFKVLDDNECDQGTQKAQQRKFVRQRSPPKKQRSHSEETKAVKIAEQSNYKEHDRLRRSKIPTPVMNLKTSLSKSDKHLERHERKAFSGIEPRVPSLPNIHDTKETSLKHSRSISNLSAPLVSTYSDNDHETGSDGEEIISSATRKKRLRKRSKTRSAKSAGSDYESSNLIDSGFEPSPRSSRIPKWKHMTERGVNMSSVTQNIQSNIRRYHLERKIFQHLLDLKRLQIRSGQHNEALLVKRAIDAYHKTCAATVGAGRYTSQDYRFKSFEHFLYNSLRKIQRNGIEHMQGLPETPRNPLLCTERTHRCDHATHAYTGVPCAAYLPKMDHHTIPKIGFECKPSGFLPKIKPKNTVTLELCHGNDKQVISLPAERLDQNKRYYVTFTVKGNENNSTTPSEEVKAESSVGHRHSKSD